MEESVVADAPSCGVEGAAGGNAGASEEEQMTLNQDACYFLRREPGPILQTAAAGHAAAMSALAHTT